MSVCSGGGDDSNSTVACSCFGRRCGPALHIVGLESKSALAALLFLPLPYSCPFNLPFTPLVSVFPPQEALESIAFKNVGCSVHGCAALDELMCNTASLRRLHLYNNMSDNEGAASIAR